MPELETDLKSMTYNAQQWAAMIEEHVTNRPYEDVRAKALSVAMPKIMRVLLGNLKEAIAAPAGGHGPGEFDIPEFRDPLLRTFNNEKIVQVMDDQIDLEEGALLYAGTWEDWADGIEAAREALGLGGGNFTKTQRAKFWRDFIYGPARIGMDEHLYANEDKYTEGGRLNAQELYKTTIQARLMEWEGGAPYWLILEYGNHDNNLAFPRFRGTFFLEKSRREAQLIYTRELLNIENQVENIVLREVEKFLDNPDSYEPYDILAQFYADSKKYNVYVTKTRRIGVALRVRRT